MPKASTSAPKPRMTSAYNLRPPPVRALRVAPPRSAPKRADGPPVDYADEVDVPCPECSDILPTREDLGKHIRTEHAGKRVCGICRQSPQNLDEHCMVHAGALQIHCSFTLRMTIDGTRSVIVPCPFRCSSSGNLITHNIRWHGEYAGSKSKNYTAPKNSNMPRWPANAVVQLDYLLGKRHDFLGNHPLLAKKFEEDVRRALDEQPGTMVTEDFMVVSKSPKVQAAKLAKPRKGNAGAVSAETSSTTSDAWEPVLVPSNCPPPDSGEYAVPYFYPPEFNRGTASFHDIPIKLSNTYPRRVRANISIWGIYDRFFNLAF